MIKLFYQWFSYRKFLPYKLMPMTGVQSSKGGGFPTFPTPPSMLVRTGQFDTMEHVQARRTHMALYSGNRLLALAKIWKGQG